MSESHYNWPIVGNQPIVRYLQHSIEVGNLSHAYLFHGPPQIGKATVARYFIHSLFCQAKVKPCFDCQTCQQISNQLHPEVAWLKREVDEKTGKLKKNISIEQIRVLIDKLSLHSFDDSYKVAVIDQAHHLSLGAANALLKTLEEPSSKTILILIADTISSLPQTIASRCQAFKFLPVDSEQITNWLKTQGADSKKAKRLSLLAFGRPGVSLDYLIQGDIYEEYKQLVGDLVKLSQQDIIGRFNTIGQLINSYDLKSVLDVITTLEKIWRDVLLAKNQTTGLITHLQFDQEIDQMAKKHTSQFIVEVLKSLELAKGYIAANVNPKLLMENLVLNF